MNLQEIANQVGAGFPWLAVGALVLYVLQRLKVIPSPTPGPGPGPTPGPGPSPDRPLLNAIYQLLQQLLAGGGLRVPAQGALADGAGGPPADVILVQTPQGVARYARVPDPPAATAPGP